MILPVLMALLTAVGPLLRGAWDVWAQAILQLALVSGFSLWVLSRIVLGYVPLPSSRTLGWVAVLLALSGLSAWMSPLHGLARPALFTAWASLWIFPAMAAITKDQRFWIDEAIRVCAWILMALAFYQRFSLGEERPPSALLNANVYAGTALMFLALAAEKKDWLLAWGLLWSLSWTRSVGAWLGLSLALMLTQRRSYRFGFWVGTVVAIACAVAVYGKLNSPEVVHRWWWWKAACAMAWDRPWTGYGPGAFAYMLPAYLSLPVSGLLSLYAHQYALETFSNLGLLFGIVWFAGLWHCLERNTSHKRFGVVAALFHSLWDYPLSMPANLWLFSYFAASSIPHSGEGMNIRGRYKFFLAAAVAGVGYCAGRQVWRYWDGHRMAARAVDAARQGRWEEARSWGERAHRRVADDPEAAYAAASVEMGRAMARPAESQDAWRSAARYLEAATRLNPYRASAWNELSFVYRKLGRADLADEASRRSRRFFAFPKLR
ncbi:MAG: O-antigen ligase family protein [Elusimicrobia bacterium]|nr:O-antigen ligase family protein [Elusimicrobiota bacterium]